MEKYKLKRVDIRLKLAQVKPLYSSEAISSPEKAIEVLAAEMAGLDREHCLVLNLDSATHPINFNVVSMGDINQTTVPIQNLFKSAILSNAAYIIVLHNHTSGNVNPSSEDIKMTQKMISAGKLMNIPVLDHVIVAGSYSGSCFSFKEKMLELWKEEINE